MAVAPAVRPAALGTLGTPARSGARWRVHTALSALGRRIGATRRTSIPSRTRGDIAHCAPAAVCASARSGTPWPTSRTRTEAGHRRASTRAPFLDVHLALGASARCPRPALNPQQAISRQPKWVLENPCRFAHRIEQHIRVHLKESGLSLHACPHHLPVPDRLDRHSRTLNHTDLSCGCALLAGALQSQRAWETGINDVTTNAAKDARCTDTCTHTCTHARTM